jgi:hypothetical protein
MRVLVCRIRGCASLETQEIKIAATEQLIRKYDINFCAFMGLNFNWTNVISSANLASWFLEEERELRQLWPITQWNLMSSSANTSQGAQA